MDVAALVDTAAVGVVWWTLGAASAIVARRLWAAWHGTPS